jgi:hypothetical protein
MELLERLMQQFAGDHGLFRVSAIRHEQESGSFQAVFAKSDVTLI